MRRRTILTSFAALAAGGCAPTLADFNRFTPRDQGARRAVEGEAFGPGPRQKLDLYVPKVPAVGSAPVLVFFYGGSWDSGARSDYAFVGNAFASRGFITAIPDYRIKPDVYPSFIEDGARALRWVTQNVAAYGGDPTRIVLAGHSAGAYIAMMLGLDARYVTDAGVEARVIRGVAGLSGPYDFYPFDVASTQAAFGAAADPVATQPIHFVRPDAPPLFLAWGAEDTLVGRQNIDHLAAAERAQGGAVETHIYPHVGHAGLLLALAEPLRSRAPVFADVIAFARRVT